MSACIRTYDPQAGITEIDLGNPFLADRMLPMGSMEAAQIWSWTSSLPWRHVSSWEHWKKKVGFQYGESSLIHDGLNLLTMITLICIS